MTLAPVSNKQSVIISGISALNERSFSKKSFISFVMLAITFGGMALMLTLCVTSIVVMSFGAITAAVNISLASLISGNKFV